MKKDRVEVLKLIEKISDQDLDRLRAKIKKKFEGPLKKAAPSLNTDDFLHHAINDTLNGDAAIKNEGGKTIKIKNHLFDIVKARIDEIRLDYRKKCSKRFLIALEKFSSKDRAELLKNLEIKFEDRLRKVDPSQTIEDLLNTAIDRTLDITVDHNYPAKKVDAAGKPINVKSYLYVTAKGWLTNLEEIKKREKKAGFKTIQMDQLENDVLLKSDMQGQLIDDANFNHSTYKEVAHVEHNVIERMGGGENQLFHNIISLLSDDERCIQVVEMRLEQPGKGDYSQIAEKLKIHIKEVYKANTKIKKYLESLNPKLATIKIKG